MNPYQPFVLNYCKTIGVQCVSEIDEARWFFNIQFYLNLKK